MRGPVRTLSFFATQERLMGTATFFSGVALVLSGWCFVGISIEAVGFASLWGCVHVRAHVNLLPSKFNAEFGCARRNYFPAAVSFMQKLPVLGYVLGFPVIAPVVNLITGQPRAANG